MRYGTIVRFFPEKGFGFIRPDDESPDVFFHVTALGACELLPEIEPGQPVKFELEARTKSKRSSRPAGGDQQATRRAQLRAKLVELIDKMPGRSFDDVDDSQQVARHPRARRKKPTWRK